MSAGIATSDLITRVLTDHEHVTTTVTANRTRVLRNAQKVVSWIWTYRNWDFRMSYGTDTIYAANSGVVTNGVNLLSTGPSGALFIDGQTDPLDWIAPREWTRLWLPANAQYGLPKYYTDIWSGGDGGGKHWGVYPLPDQDYGFTWTGVRRSPTLTDADPGGLGDDAMTIPEEWHETCVYEGVIYYQMKDKANAQSKMEQWSLWMSHMKNMCNEERGGRSEVHRIVPYGVRPRRRFV